MIDQWRQLASELGDRLHADQRGAITLAALAALMILIMTALIIWDAGRSARDKIDVQNAADTAAYSQASVRARSMNMLAFSNVAKREVVSLHSMYYGMFTGFAIWFAVRCNSSSVHGDDSRIDCDNNRMLFMREGGSGGEWSNFSGHSQSFGDERYQMEGKLAKKMYSTHPLSQFNNISSFGPFQQPNWSERAFGHEVMALDDYQRYLVEVTPWWAWTQALVRGTRNGAHAISSFPPPGPSTVGNGWIQQAVGGVNKSADDIYDFEVSCGDRQSGQLLNRARPQADFTDFLPNSVNDQLFRDMAHEACIPIQAADTLPISATAIGQPAQQNRSPMTDPLLSAIDGNFDLHSRLSNADADDGEPFTLGLIYAIEAAPPGLVPNPRIAAGGGCWWSSYLFTNINMFNFNWNDECDSSVRFYSVPYSLGANADSVAANGGADDLMARSNIVFSYRHTPERAMTVVGGGRIEGAGDDSDHRNLMENRDYRVENASNPIYSTRGYWSMARAEIVYPHLQQNRDMQEGVSARGRWLFRPGWTAKLRPMALPGEWRNLNYGLNGAFHATDEYFEVAAQMGLLTNADGPNSVNEVVDDFEFMDRATQSLDSQAMEGVVK